MPTSYSQKHIFKFLSLPIILGREENIFKGKVNMSFFPHIFRLKSASQFMLLEISQENFRSKCPHSHNYFVL